MKTFTSNVARLVVVSALFASSAVLAQPQAGNSEQPQTVNEININQQQLVDDLHQQLVSGIKQQVSTTLQSMAESLKSLITN
ncbi:hypothetical protein HRH59_16535 [Rheinheimera sp. YQF-2]|uniref:Uncharacterized protein n=1 Tax=Rheinheimera lutimaris TaxID=2740584 RepID=A0A7Y5ATB6_9GAMM|nr:hypothetical protein [Rheinheimera lutimaris]NRQ44153.1 hypothetical protein [Rheinheimera lutimaris]